MREGKTREGDEGRWRGRKIISLTIEGEGYRGP